MEKGDDVRPDGVFQAYSESPDHICCDIVDDLSIEQEKQESPRGRKDSVLLCYTTPHISLRRCYSFPSQFYLYSRLPVHLL